MIQTKRRLLGFTAACLCAVSVGTEATAQRLQPVPGLPLATNMAASGPLDPVVFNNSAPSGLFYDVSGGFVVFDEGRIPTKTAPETGALDTYSLTAFEFAYVTRALDPSAGGPGARAVVTFYSEADLCAGPLALPMPAERFTLTGLPGSPVAGQPSTHTVTVNAPSPICFFGDGDGTFDAGEVNHFVWSIAMPDENQGPAGPLVAGDPLTCPMGAGTYFQTGSACATGLGAGDKFAVLTPNGVYSCMDFGGYPANAFGSFHLVARAPIASECAGCGVGDPFLEDNDTCATAETLSSGRTVGLIAEAGDDDHYRFFLPANTFVRAVTIADAGSADLDLELLDGACGNVLASASTLDSAEVLEYFRCAGVGDDVVLRVIAPPSGCATYDLIVELEQVVDDAMEDNDVCTQSAFAGVTTFTTEGLVVTECDSDHFALRLFDQREVQVNLLFDPANTDVELTLYDINCSTILAQGQPTPGGLSARYFNNTGIPSAVIANVRCTGGKGFTEYALTACYSVGDIIGFQTCTGVPNSTGKPGTMCVRGSEVAADNLVLFYSVDLPPLAFGYFVTSPGQGFTPNPAGATGNLCLADTNVGRYFFDILQTSNNNAVFYQPDLTQTPTGPGFASVQPGETRYWQFWYRDSDGMGGTTSNFSSGVGVTFQ